MCNTFRSKSGNPGNLLASKIYYFTSYLYISVTPKLFEVSRLKSESTHRLWKVESN